MDASHHPSIAITALAVLLILSLLLNIVLACDPSATHMRAAVTRMINPTVLAHRKDATEAKHHHCASPTCEASGEGYETHECTTGGCLGRPLEGSPPPASAREGVDTWKEALGIVRTQYPKAHAMIHDRATGMLLVWNEPISFRRTLSGSAAFHIIR